MGDLIIMKGEMMKKIFIILMVIVGLSLAVQPVSQHKNEGDIENTNIKIDPGEEHKDDKANKQTKIEIKIIDKKGDNIDNGKDSIQDADSNNINDQREDDLLKIKWIKIKFKDLFKKEPVKKTEPKKPIKPEKKNK